MFSLFDPPKADPPKADLLASGELDVNFLTNPFSVKNTNLSRQDAAPTHFFVQLIGSITKIIKIWWE
jgi:hypothetical protein